MALGEAMDAARDAQEDSDAGSVSSEETSASGSSTASRRRPFDHNAEAGPSSRPLSRRSSMGSRASRAKTADRTPEPLASRAHSDSEEASSDDEEADSEEEGTTNYGEHENGSRQDEDHDQAGENDEEGEDVEEDESEDEDENEDEGEEEEPCVIVDPICTNADLRKDTQVLTVKGADTGSSCQRYSIRDQRIPESDGESPASLVVLTAKAIGTHVGMVHVMTYEGAKVNSFRPHAASVTCLTMDEDNDFVATASVEGK